MIKTPQCGRLSARGKAGVIAVVTLFLAIALCACGGGSAGSSSVSNNNAGSAAASTSASNSTSSGAGSAATSASSGDTSATSAVSAASSAAASSAASSTTSGAAEDALDRPINAIALNGPTGISMAKLSQNDAYNLRFVGATDEVVSSLTSGSVDIAAIPTNLAATLYNKTQGGVQMLAINTFGSLFLLENGESVTTWDDLRGRKLYATGQGANPQYILEFLLTQAGLEPGVDVEIEYLPEHAELAALLASGEAELGMLPEPFVSVTQSRNPDVRVALDLGHEWEAATGSGLAMGCVVARTEFAQEHPQATRQFIADLEESVRYTMDYTDDAAVLCAELGILPSYEVGALAIPRCSIVCLAGDDASTPVKDFLSVLFEANPQSVGGELPDRDFFYELEG